MECESRPGCTAARRFTSAKLIALVALASVTLGFGSATRAEPGAIEIELNKLEPHGDQCRTYFVVTNKDSANYEALKLDLVLFQPDGVIGRRFAVDLAPVKSNKRAVKLFELGDTSCDDIGSFLINEVMECRADSGPVSDCLDDISVSSLTEAQLTK